MNGQGINGPVEGKKALRAQKAVATESLNFFSFWLDRTQIKIQNTRYLSVQSKENKKLMILWEPHLFFLIFFDWPGSTRDLILAN